MANKIKGKYIFWGVIAFALLAVLFALSLMGAKNKGEDARSTYTMQLSFDENSNTLTGRQTIDYVNTSDNMFTSLPFHLYPNAFREGSKTPVVSTANKAEAYPNGESFGQIEITSVKYIDKSPANFEICGKDNNILNVILQEELYPEESTQLEISFITTLPNINHRLGFGENTINFGNFYPVVCVYEEGVGFSQNPYHSNGDPFYSECADYYVSIEYSSNFTIASGGEITESTQKEDKNLTQIKGENIRDFCFVLSKKFDKVSMQIDDVEVNYFGYAGDENLQVCLQTSVDAISTFQEMYGKYPYNQISIVKSNFVHGGMEYPNIVLISDKITAQNDINYVIVHELAHQWWYGLVGNDQYNHAWIDEGLAEFSTLLFFERHESYAENPQLLVENAIQSYKLFEKVYTKVAGSVDGTMQRPLCDFNTEPEYVQCVYTKGLIMFDCLREGIGEKKLLQTLKYIVKLYSYKTISSAEFIACFADKCGKSMEGFFQSWLDGRVVIQ